MTRGSRFDTVAILLALGAHVGIAYGLAHMPRLPQPKSSTVEFDLRKAPPPVETPKLTTPAPPPTEPERKVIPRHKVVRAPAATPPPNAEPPKQPPAEPPKATPKPVFGVTMDSTTESDSSFSVPVGNTTMIDPAKSAKASGPIAPLPAQRPGAPVQSEYRPVSALYIRTMPDIDAEACGRTIAYPAEAEQLGIEGDVKLRVALDEKGGVREVHVLSGLGHGLDQAAVYALRHKCKFSPAIATDGKPAAFVIPSYTFHFEIPR